MKITLKTFADFREIIGAKEADIVLPDGETIGELLNELCKIHHGLQRKLFDETAKLRPFIIVLKNGRNISSLQQLATPVADGDVIALFPPVAGG